MGPEIAEGHVAVEQRDYDAFFLHHLQSVKGEAAWYLNQRFIGKGGNGTTFFVTCTSGINFGVQFALKVFHRISDVRRRERFLEEVRHYRTLSHPSIIKIYDEGVYTAGERAYPFAVIDFVPENLEVKLGKGLPRITRLDAIRYATNVASGIAYLHSLPQPIVHRDIKPANILVAGQAARLGDLGLAKVLMGDDAAAEAADEVASYMAMPWFYRTPELVRIARGEKLDLTPASDVYQLGLVLYRSVTGFNPQRPVRAEQILDDIELDVREIVGAAGPRMDWLLGMMLAEDPAQRPTAVEVLGQLNIIHREICEADFAATGMMR